MEGDEERKEDPEHTRGATICRDGKNHGKSARGVALPVVGGIAARALWSHIVKRSDANGRKKILKKIALQVSMPLRRKQRT